MGVLQNCWAGNFRAAQHEYVDCGAHAAFNYQPGLNEFSVQAWFSTSTGPNGDHLLIARGNSTAVQYGVGTNGDTVIVYIGGARYSFSSLPMTVNDGAWHHVVVSFGVSSFLLVVDGTYSVVQPFSSSATSASDLLVGARRNLTNDDAADNWDGYVDEVGVWRSALSLAECAALYNSGSGLMLNDSSGAYTSSGALDGWWRMGDGDTEHPSGVPTAIISDESGNARNGVVTSDALDLSLFYYGGVADAVPGDMYCILEQSSSSITVVQEVGATFTVTRNDQGNLRSVVGYGGNVFRMVLTCEASQGLTSKIFVHEYGRPIPGVSIRNVVFRRVATLMDLAAVPEDEPGTKFPFAYRTNTANIFAMSQSQLDQAWLEVQRQCAILSYDMLEFGTPVGTGVLTGGRGTTTFIDKETFGGVAPPDIDDLAGISSSSAGPVEGSSSEAPPQQSSSSSEYVDPNLFTDAFYLESEDDAVVRLTDDATKTLYSRLGFVRFGRDIDPLRTWDSFIRIPVAIQKCALIESATLRFLAKTSETGEDVVLRVYAIYADASFNPVGAFVSTDDPAVARDDVVWGPLAPVLFAGAGQAVDVTDALQFFVDRDSHVPGDYFGVWIKEVVSDPGARRDGVVNTSTSPVLQVTYRTDRTCSSSSS